MRIPIGAWRRLYSLRWIISTTRFTSPALKPPATISAYMENDLSPAEMVAGGFSAGDVKRVVEMIHRSEYKRRQAPIGIRITHRGFGKDWRYPITSRYREPYA